VLGTDSPLYADSTGVNIRLLKKMHISDFAVAQTIYCIGQKGLRKPQHVQQMFLHNLINHKTMKNRRYHQLTCTMLINEIFTVPNTSQTSIRKSFRQMATLLTVTLTIALFICTSRNKFHCVALKYLY
jgi:hypothetical protein